MTLRECLCHRDSDANGSHEGCCGHDGGRNPDCPFHGDGSGGGLGIVVHNYDSPAQPDPGEKTWDTAELQRDFEVLGFSAPYVAVRRRSDKAAGTLEFKHSPRVYFNFRGGVA